MTNHLPGRHLLHNALGFAAAARHVASMPGCHAGELLLQNLGNAIELSLKSILQAHGSSELPRFDGVSQLWFDDEAALAAILGSARFRDVVKPDERNFIDVGSAMVLSAQEER